MQCLAYAVQKYNETDKDMADGHVLIQLYSNRRFLVSNVFYI